MKKNLSFVFNALGDETRLNIFFLVANTKDLCVSDVASVFRISVPAASYQLRILELAGLVRGERNGQMICYQLQKENPLVPRILRVLLP